MHYDDFIQQVQERADLATRDDAVAATRATLATLGERLYRTVRDNLAAQLDDDLKPYLSAETEPATSREQVPPFNLEAFYVRVSGRADVTITEAADQARAVITVLREAISPGQWDAVTEELPPDYNELWGGELSGVAHTRTDGTYEVNP
jgi:uncharacterized protein (DUF2267 family)